MAKKARTITSWLNLLNEPNHNALKGARKSCAIVAPVVTVQVVNGMLLTEIPPEDHRKPNFLFNITVLHI
jgi:hypothetical protein